MSEKIDFVILWVDGNDPEWNEEKNKYSNKNLEEASIENRYRDWDNLQYWFRGIEKFAPWVNKIHFVTCGHLPKWLNKDHPKLNIVTHKDYMPEEYLPTFNSNAIEINLHRIKELSEKFVYFNDDIFLINSVKEEDFFKNGSPCDFAAENTIIATGVDDVYNHILLNNLGVINHNFSKRKVIKENFFKWFNIKNGKSLMKTIQLLPWQEFSGFSQEHLANSYKKSTFEEVWNREYEIMDATSKNKFRSNYDVSQGAFKFWQIAKGDFEVRNKKIGKCYQITNKNLSEVCEIITNQKHRVICLNDSDMKLNFEEAKEKIAKALDVILPDKSEFEI